MKKLFIVMAVASLGFVACNNESASETTPEDSIRVADSLAKVAADSAAAATAQDTLAAAQDTTAKADTLKK